MSMFTEDLQIATPEHCSARWCCAPPGERFRCGFCGYKFKQGDKWRAIYTNDMPTYGGNPLVCEKCNDSNSQLRARWQDKWNAWRRITAEPEFWWFQRKGNQ